MIYIINVGVILYLVLLSWIVCIYSLYSHTDKVVRMFINFAENIQENITVVLATVFLIAILIFLVSKKLNTQWPYLISCAAWLFIVRLATNSQEDDGSFRTTTEEILLNNKVPISEELRRSWADSIMDHSLLLCSILVIWFAYLLWQKYKARGY